jgi:mono/diheme cytochrome c family protein
MFEVYCQACHGVDGLGEAPVNADEDRNGNPVSRFKAIPTLAGGPGMAKNINDETLYLTIRNGKGRMPGYGHAMFDEEIWAVVSYVRTLPDAKYKGK